MNHDFCIRLDDKAHADEAQSKVDDLLFPEYELGGKWYPCSAMVTTTKRRSTTIYYLHPLLFSRGVGVIVNPSIPIRVRHSTDAFCRQAVEAYRRIYHRCETLAPQKNAAHHKAAKAAKGGAK